MFYLIFVAAVFLALAGHFCYLRLTRSYFIRQHHCVAPFILPDAFPYTGAHFLKTCENIRRTPDWPSFLQALLGNPGRTTVVKVWGETWLFTSSPANLQALCTTAPVSIERLRKPAGSDWLGDGIFISDGHKWKLSRSLFKPMFSRSSISGWLPNVEIHFQRLLGQLPRDGSTFDLQPLLKRLYLDISSEILLGESFCSQCPQRDQDIDFDAFEESWAFVLKAMSRKLTFGLTSLPHNTSVELRKHISSVHRLFDSQIYRQLNSEEKTTGSMLQELAKHSRDPRFLRDQLLNVFIGAKDTGALGLGFLFFHLVRHPDVMYKLRVEISRVQPGEELNFERLKSMKYMQCVIAESLRLLSPVTRSLRTTTKDCVLPAGGGPDGQQPIFVPKATRVEISIRALHEDEQIWGPSAAEFWPERWDQHKSSSSAQWEYVPFLGGARICPAQQMVLTQYAYILVRFLQSVSEIRNRDPDLAFRPQVVLSQESKNGVLVAIQR